MTNCGQKTDLRTDLRVRRELARGEVPQPPFPMYCCFGVYDLVEVDRHSGLTGTVVYHSTHEHRRTSMDCRRDAEGNATTDKLFFGCHSVGKTQNNTDRKCSITNLCWSPDTLLGFPVLEAKTIHTIHSSPPSLNASICPIALIYVCIITDAHKQPSIAIFLHPAFYDQYAAPSTTFSPIAIGQQ